MESIGVFICSGCGIGDAINTGALSEAAKECGVTVVQAHPSLCSAQGVALIADSVQQNDLDGVVIAACPSRHKKNTFCFCEKKAALRRVCLREQVAWIRASDGKDIQAVAEDQLAMGIAALKMEHKPMTKANDVNRSVLVVGAGLCGLVAADSVAQIGYHVYLVEKESQMGGYLRGVGDVAPWQSPFDAPVPNPIWHWMDKIQRNPNVTQMIGTTVSGISGQPGQFCVYAADQTFWVGSVIQTTGALPVKRQALGDFYDVQCQDVITSADLESLLLANVPIGRPTDSMTPQSIVFIQCAGSRVENGLPYCSRECCQNTLKQIHQIQRVMPDVECMVIYKDIRTPGLTEAFYTSTLELENVTLIKGDVYRIEPHGGQVMVSVDNTVVEDSLCISADLVVAATGMVPCAADGEALRALKEAAVTIHKNESNQQVMLAEERIQSLKHLDTPSILNLDYRQGPDLPQLAYRFADSHFICFPYETRRTGIYTAGTVRAPMDIAMGISDAKGAALMAVQCVESAKRGESMLPRIADIDTAEFFMQRCTQCKRCTEECPFGALNEDEKGNPVYNPTRCRRCGVCLGACPERIVSFASCSVDIVAAMIKAPAIPDEFEDKPRVLVFMCENDAAPALDAAAQKGMKINPWVRFVEIRCLGSFHNVWVAEALCRGYDGVLLMGCKQGEDYQCHNIHGSQLAHTRIDNIGETLERLGLEKERVKVVEVARDESELACQLIEQFTTDVEALGPNPLKAF